MHEQPRRWPSSRDIINACIHLGFAVSSVPREVAAPCPAPSSRRCRASPASCAEVAWGQPHSGTTLASPAAERCRQMETLPCSHRGPGSARPPPCSGWGGTAQIAAPEPGQGLGCSHQNPSWQLGREAVPIPVRPGLPCWGTRLLPAPARSAGPGGQPQPVPAAQSGLCSPPARWAPGIKPLMSCRLEGWQLVINQGSG